jgi:hypothetical protein
VPGAHEEKEVAMRRTLTVLVAVGAVLFLLAVPASATAGKGLLYHDGDIVRTVVTTSPIPNGGTDPFYAVANGVEGQLGIAGLAPGDAGYSGGDWAFNQVTFTVEPYLLTSEAAVLAAEAAGDVTVERISSMDFRCPVQP